MERKAQGAKLGAEDVVEVQRDVQRQKQLERAQKDVQRVLQTASESENKLDVALKVCYSFYGFMGASQYSTFGCDRSVVLPTLICLLFSFTAD